METSNSANNGAWNSCGYTCKSGAQYAILNGDTVNAATGTGTNSGGSTSTRTQMGIRHYSTTFDYCYDGRLASVAFWNEYLVLSELLALHNGAHPFSIRKGALKEYYPLWGMDTDARNYAPLSGTTSYNLALYNNPARSDGPPVEIYHDTFGRDDFMDVMRRPNFMPIF